MPWPDLCLPDDSTFQDAIDILKMCDVWDRASEVVQDYLEPGCLGLEPETLKAKDNALQRHHRDFHSGSRCRDSCPDHQIRAPILAEHIEKINRFCYVEDELGDSAEFQAKSVLGTFTAGFQLISMIFQ